jgi:DNA ligase (NAD+)
MTELENKIKKLADSYYNGKEQISDKEYDSLIEQLRIENPSSKLLDTICGSDSHIEGFKKGRHWLITGTLLKLKNEDELKEWYSKHSGRYYVEQKCDGAGIELQYVNGKLNIAITRGDGFVGDCVTANAKKICGVKTNLKFNFTGSIRGEIVLKYGNFDKYFSDMKNCRNAAAGIMKHLDGKDCEKLNFIAYELKDKAEVLDVTEKSKMDFLKKEGFEIPAYEDVNSLEEILKFRNFYVEERKKRNLDGFDIDGIVLKTYECDREDLFNRTPKYSQVAIKFDLTEAVSTIESIEWTLSGRYLSPVAHITPVELCGTTVSKASLSNYRLMADMGVKIGAKCLVVKAGEIIPKIIKIL